MSDSKLVHIAFTDAAVNLPPPFCLLWCHSVEIFMLLLHLLLSFSFYSNPGPRTSRPSCHFLGLYENASSFSEQKKGVRSFAFGGVTDPHITYPEMKTKGTTTSKKNVINMDCVCSAGGWSEAAPGCERWGAEAGRFSHSDSQGWRNKNQHVGLFRLFFKKLHDEGAVV